MLMDMSIGDTLSYILMPRVMMPGYATKLQCNAIDCDTNEGHPYPIVYSPLLADNWAWRLLELGFTS